MDLGPVIADGAVWLGLPPDSYERYLREIYGPVLELSAALYTDRAGTEYNAWIEPRRIFATAP